jgi:hypothetical protein
MTVGPRVRVLTMLLLPVGYADAQTPPWPGEPGAAQSAPPASVPVKPWPSAAPMMRAPPCMAEFTKLREEVEKKGATAKAAGRKQVSRAEMCKLITIYAASEAKWVKFTEAGVATCGIPAGIVNQLQEVHAKTERTREKVCADSVAPYDLSPLWPRVHMDDFPTDDGQ